MLNLLAQTTGLQTTETDSSALAIFGGAFLIFWLAFAVLMLVSSWKIFTKAGRAGWISLIPVYNAWTLAEIAGKPGWWSLVFLIAWVPVLGAIAAIVVSIILSIELAKSFGKDPAYAALLILLPFVGYPMLAFGDATYVGPGGQSGANTTVPPQAPAAPVA